MSSYQNFSANIQSFFDHPNAYAYFLFTYVT